MANIFITGGTGMIGSYCARRALEQGHTVVLFDAAVDHAQIRDFAGDVKQVIEGDILDQETLRRALVAGPADAIIHTAAVLALGVEQNPLLGVRVNVEGSVGVMQAALEASVPRVVLFSSTMIYSQADLDGHEQVSENREAEPDSLYAATKHAAELMGRSMARTRGLEFVALRLARVFGSGYRRPGATPNPSTNWMNEMAHRAMAGKGGPTIPALGMPDEWVYAADVADAAVRAATVSGIKIGTFNIGTGALWSPRDLVNAFTAASGVLFEYVEPPVPQGAVRAYRMRKPLDLTAAKQQLGYRPRFVTPVDAIRQFLAMAAR
jgi:nucleoside-diphosphate-sugar epimerase